MPIFGDSECQCQARGGPGFAAAYRRSIRVRFPRMLTCAYQRPPHEIVIELPGNFLRVRPSGNSGIDVRTGSGCVLRDAVMLARQLGEAPGYAPGAEVSLTCAAKARRRPQTALITIVELHSSWTYSCRCRLILSFHLSNFIQFGLTTVEVGAC